MNLSFESKSNIIVLTAASQCINAPLIARTMICLVQLKMENGRIKPSIIKGQPSEGNSVANVVLLRLQAFLPQLESSTKLLSQRIKDGHNVDIEDLEVDEEHVEMELSLGVFDIEAKPEVNLDLRTTVGSGAPDIKWNVEEAREEVGKRKEGEEKLEPVQLERLKPKKKKKPVIEII